MYTTLWYKMARLFLPAAALAAGIFLASSFAAEENTRPPAPPAVDAKQAGEYPVPPPPFSKGIYPCTECHNKDMPVNRSAGAGRVRGAAGLKRVEDCHG